MILRLVKHKIDTPINIPTPNPNQTPRTTPAIEILLIDSRYSSGKSKLKYAFENSPLLYSGLNARYHEITFDILFTSIIF